MNSICSVIRTDIITSIEGLVVGPKSVVDAGVPAFVSSDNVVGGVDGGGNGGEEEEEENREIHVERDVDRSK